MEGNGPVVDGAGVEALAAVARVMGPVSAGGHVVCLAGAGHLGEDVSIGGQVGNIASAGHLGGSGIGCFAGGSNCGAVAVSGDGKGVVGTVLQFVTHLQINETSTSQTCVL